MSGTKQAYRDWSNSGLSLQFAAVIIFASSLIAGGGYLIEQLPLQVLQQLGGAAAVYFALTLAYIYIPTLGARKKRQAVILAGLMVLYIAIAALLLRSPVMADLLMIPVAFIAIRVSARDAWQAALVCACIFLAIRIGQKLELAALLAAAAELIVLAILLHIFNLMIADLGKSRRRITELLFRDELTGLLNMSAFTRMLQRAHENALANTETYALLMIDIEGLQRFNDKYGHEQGNRVISAVADAIRRGTGSEDLVARYGGDEFIVYLAKATDERTESVSARISQNIHNINLSFDRDMQKVSANIGKASFPDSGNTIQQMMSFADRSMYSDKKFKKNLAEKKSDPAQLRQQAGIEGWN